MATEVKFPSVGESITEGVLGAWTRKNGDYVESGDSIAEIETDKVTSEIFAEVSGVLTHSVKEGENIDVGQIIGSIDETAEPPQKPAKDKEAPAGESGKEQAHAKQEEESKRPVKPTGGEPMGPGVMDRLPMGHSTPAAGNDREEAAAGATTGSANAALLSPAVRALVEEHGIDPQVVPATGKDGRLLKSDVLAFVAEAQKRGVSAAAAAAPAGPRQTRKKMTPLRQKIAERLVTAQSEAALLTTFNECDMSNVMAIRKQFQDRFVESHEIKLGFMSFFVKAVVHALKAVPGINAQIDGDEIIQNHYYDIGVAISTERGLMVPVLRDCDQMSLADVEAGIIAYAKKARGGKITLPDLEGGVFTITNGGIFGSMLSTPLLNPPQAGILGMHSITERPMAVDGRVEIRPMMYLALTYDHRIVDGKEAVTFLVRVKEAIEQPAVHLLGL